MKDIRDVFRALAGHDRPLVWQERLLEQLLAGELPTALDLPTGLGKTSVMALWLLALAQQMRDGGQPKLPRRLVYVVDRRAVVDQATAEAEKLQKALQEQPELAWMRAAFGLAEDEALPVSTLRGQLADNRAWLADPSKPAIIIGTVDMVGSRLLFSGYGVSRRERPYMAGLLGVDTLFVLDESHLVPPFERLLEQIAKMDGHLWPRDEEARQWVRPMQVLPLSATGRERQQAFRLEAADEEDAIVRRRLHAPKRLVLQRAALGGDSKALAAALAEAGWAAAFEMEGEGGEGSERPRRMERRGTGEGGQAHQRAPRVLIYADSREVAQQVAEALRKRAKGAKRSDPPRAQVELFTGARRVMERQQAAERLLALGFLAGNRGQPEHEDEPAFLVATSAAEVGVDMDADVMVGDLVPLERMIQRFGRVNRLGELADCTITVLVDEDGLAQEKDEDRRQRLQAVVRALEKLKGDASPAALKRLKETHAALVEKASTPPPLYPPLERPTVEAWAMTSLPEHTGRPDIRPWLRGWVQEEPQAIIIWRQYLPWRPGQVQPLKEEVRDFFRVAPAHLLEQLEAPAGWIADVLIKRAKRWQDQLRKEKADGSAEGQASVDGVPALLALSPAGEFRQGWTLGQLAAEKGSTLTPAIAGCLLVAARELGGLNGSGLLDSKAADAPDTLDAGWSEAWQQSIGYRVRLERRPLSLDGEEATEQRETPSDEVRRSEEGAQGPWRQQYVLVLERDGHDEPTSWLVVEALRSPGRQEGDPSIARIDYGLKPHLEDVAQEAARLAARLHLPQRWQELLRQAGQWHDVGKNRTLWQLAANAPVERTQRLRQRLDSAEAYAKTKGPFRPQLLGGYRHEFGSLLDARDDPALQALPEEERDIILHLVAAHHGQARPVINAVDPLHPPSRLQQEAAEAALRFARLQKRFGPWGLAWLEALLRAADRKASAALEAENEAAASTNRRSAANG